MSSINIYDFFALDKNKDDEKVMDEYLAMELQFETSKGRRNKSNINYNINAQLNQMISDKNRPVKIASEIPEHQLFIHR